MSKRKPIVGIKNQAMNELLLVRDEARLQLHLASLDAKKTWDELESAILQLEERFKHDGEKAAEVLGDKIKELSHRLRDLVTKQLRGSAGLLTSVRTIMSDHVRSCNVQDSLNEAAHIMWEQNCGIVPVVDQGRVLGLLTDRDICMATYTQGKAPAAIPVAQAMSHGAYDCSADDSIGTALSLMAEQRLRRLPVLNSEGYLAGMLALADIARFASSAGSAHLDAALAETLGVISKQQAPLAKAAE